MLRLLSKRTSSIRAVPNLVRSLATEASSDVQNLHDVRIKFYFIIIY